MFAEGVGVVRREVLSRGRELMNVLGRQRFSPQPPALRLHGILEFPGGAAFKKNSLNLNSRAFLWDFSSPHRETKGSPISSDP